MRYEEHQPYGPALRIIGPEKRAGARAGAGTGGRARTPRLFPVSRVGRVVAGSRRGLARVMSLCDDAMVLSTRLHPHLGEQLTVDVSTDCSLTGTVIWTQPGECGLKLTTRIDSAALMQRLSLEQEAERERTRRRRRWWPEKTVVVRSELGLQIVRLRDVSRTSARIVHDGRFLPGMTVKLQLAPGIERPGVLSWSRDGIAGVELSATVEKGPQGAETRM